MIAGRQAEILRQLEELQFSDRELLARFARERDQSAFAEIVRAHGSVVLGVCRRITRQLQDAEDAFQAVFLVLARKATTIRNPDALGAWLYSVAVQVARKARRAAHRRIIREVGVNPMPEKPVSLATMDSDLSPILDEEIAALPGWYRDAIVLCDLRGFSRQEAAAALGVPEGTVSSRLANGRKKLATQLTKRGIALSAAAIPTVVANAQAVTVSHELFTKTCAVVSSWMAGDAVPGSLATLAKGGFTMRKTFLLGLIATVVAVSGVVYAVQPQEKPVDPPSLPALIAKTEVTEAANLSDKTADEPVAFTSDPRLQRAYDIGLNNIGSVCWNQNGTRLAVEGVLATPLTMNKSRSQIQIISLEPARTFSLQLEDKSRLIDFTPDGRGVLTELREYQLVSGKHKLSIWDQKPDGANWYSAVREVKLMSKETRGYVFAPDGKTFRTVSIERDQAVEDDGDRPIPKRDPTIPSRGKESKLEVLDVDFTTGKPIKSLFKLDAKPPVFAHALSQDGKRLAVMETWEKVVVYDVDRGAKLCTATLNIEKSKGNRQLASGASHLVFSVDGYKLLVIRGVGQSVIVNSDSGEALPSLEGMETLRPTPGTNAFSANGRLLSLVCSRYKKTDVFDGFQYLGSTKMCVWDTQSGKLLKSWDLKSRTRVAFNPVRPVLAVLEANEDDTRLGLWDFSVEMTEKN